MAWSEHIHVHIHNDDQKEIIKLLKEIKELLSKPDDEAAKQRIMGKLDSIIADVKTTI